MTQLFGAATLVTYLLAVVALVLAPGPGQALLVAHSLEVALPDRR